MAFSYKDYEYSNDVIRRKEEADKHAEYNESGLVGDARDRYYNHMSNRIGDWTGGQWGDALKGAIDKITNRPKFSYDLNGDALYQQYKNQYIHNGRLAMMDTLGQAATLTGGYGNSYANTAGNQAYQGYLQQLNDKVPELYQLALDQYNREGDDLYRQYGMYGDMYGLEYGEYRDRVGDWNNDADRLYRSYTDERDYDYRRFADDRDYYYGAYRDERDYDYGRYSDDYDRAMAEYQLKHRSSGGGGSSGSGSGNAKLSDEIKNGALEAYAMGGEARLEYYIRNHPGDYDVDALIDYVVANGEYLKKGSSGSLVGDTRYLAVR